MPTLWRLLALVFLIYLLDVVLGRGITVAIFIAAFFGLLFVYVLRTLK